MTIDNGTGLILSVQPSLVNAIRRFAPILTNDHEEDPALRYLFFPLCSVHPGDTTFRAIFPNDTVTDRLPCERVVGPYAPQSFAVPPIVTLDCVYIFAVLSVQCRSACRIDRWRSILFVFSFFSFRGFVTHTAESFIVLATVRSVMSLRQQIVAGAFLM